MCLLYSFTIKNYVTCACYTVSSQRTTSHVHVIATVHHKKLRHMCLHSLILYRKTRPMCLLYILILYRNTSHVHAMQIHHKELRHMCRLYTTSIQFPHTVSLQFHQAFVFLWLPLFVGQLLWLTM